MNSYIEYNSISELELPGHISTAIELGANSLPLLVVQGDFPERNSFQFHEPKRGVRRLHGLIHYRQQSLGKLF